MVGWDAVGRHEGWKMCWLLAINEGLLTLKFREIFKTVQVFVFKHLICSRNSIASKEQLYNESRSTLLYPQ